MKKISLLGSTGSIGTQALDVIRSHKDKFSVEAFSFGNNLDLGLQQIHEFQPALVSVSSKEIADKLKNEVPYHVKIVYGEEGLIEVATYEDSQLLLNAVLGSVGLKPTIEGIKCGKMIAIANKETLVTAGHIVTDMAKKYEVELIPVDSEHSAIYQCLEGDTEKELSRLILTASGGSFRDRTREELAGVTVEDALNHPNWSMGAKITIDSATMMNKGLEIIEAKWLFDVPYEKIDVLLHKESIIHSMVEYIDGSVLAHLGQPDMRVPIQYALSKPKRLDLYGGKRLNLWEFGSLHFAKPDFERYHSLQLAYYAGKKGGTAPTVLNAANEIAVTAFLNGKIDFLQIEELVEKVLLKHQSVSYPSLEEILEVDQDTRKIVQSYIS